MGDSSSALDYFQEGDLSVHHRIPKSRTKDKEGRFPIRINAGFHSYWHIIFGTRHPKCICDIINKFFLAGTNYRFVCQRRKKNTKTKFYKEDVSHCKSEENSLIINKNSYLYWELIFNNKNPFDICRNINQFFIDPEWRLVCKRKKKFYKVKPYNAFAKRS